jgi:predicted NAD-dependent protein-ADP-ribosyltransferase YbiA (DUF1768 family)
MTEKDSEDAAAFMSLLESTTRMHANLYWPSKDNDFIPTAYMKAFPNFKEEEAKAVTTEKRNSRVTDQDDLDEAKLYAQQSDNDVPSMDELDEEQLITRRLVAKGKTVPAKSPTMVTDKIIPLSASQRFTRSSVEKDSNYMYLFTDNAKRTSGSNLVPDESRYSAVYGQGNKYPTTTQAVVRGLDNAFPITTMVDDKKTQWTDDRFEEFKKEIDSEIEIIKGSIPYFKGIKFSGEMPFGKGAISNMKETAPKSWAYLNSKLAEIGIDNTGKMPMPIQPSTSVNPASNKINIYAGGKGENAELSNFAVRPFSETWDLSPLGMDSETLTFNTVEGAFQATKILYSTDLKNYDLLPQFQKSSGAQAKALGQKIKGLDTEAWDSNSSVVMKDLIKKSFEQNPDALAKLIATGNATLTHTQDKSKWGKEFPRILMEVRAELRDNNLEGFDFEVTKCIVD